MPLTPPATPLAELELALVASHPDRAAEAALRAVQTRVPLLDVVRSTASVLAARYDARSGLPPHALPALAAVAHLQPSMDGHGPTLALLQAVALGASEKKLGSPNPAAAIVAGEVTHLGRSALLLARAGQAVDAEPLFLGILEDGWERRMAGDVLFRAAVEDIGENGHKLVAAVKSWQLARALGFRDARAILRPAIQFLLRGVPNRRLYETMLAVLGREWADLESLDAGARALDDDGRTRLATLLAASTDEACVTSLLALLRDGYAAGAVSQGIGIEAAKRLLAADGYHIELVHVLLCVNSARFILDFSRSSERLYAIFESALRVRSPAPHLPSVAAAEANDEAAARSRIAENLRNRRSREAAVDIRNYLARGFASRPLVALLARCAALDSSLANGGHNLLLADACIAEFAATKAPEFLMALGKSVAASPKDQTASNGWLAALGP